MSEKIRVLVVDDQALIRTGIATLLARKADMEVVGQAGNGAEALAQVAALDPDVVLMDVMMPVLDGVEATRQLAAAGARPAVIILSTFREDEQVLRGRGGPCSPSASATSWGGWRAGRPTRRSARPWRSAWAP
jgi:DNA-binding NarL/FixJ family response regulator